MNRDNKSAKDTMEDGSKRRHVSGQLEVVSLEKIFRKTRAKPPIYYKPLTEAEVRCVSIACMII